MSLPPRRGGRRLEAPLAAQIVILVCACLIISQLATVAVIFFLPPPPPPIYHLDEVAEALGGRSAHPGFSGRPLELSVESAAPVFGVDEPAARRGLAALLGVPLDDVRLSVQAPTALGQASDVAEGIWIFRWRRHLRERERSEAREGGLAPGAEKQSRHPAWRINGDPGRPVFGHFIAAVRRAPGSWVVVRPATQPFPNPWQRRVLAWLAMSFVLTAPLGYLFARRLTAPLGRFANAARRFGSDPSAPALELAGPAEIGEAARAFNDMQRRLKRFIDDRTAMVGAISHDLRTPLARIRFKLEKAPAPVRKTISRDLQQMDEMIGSVLDFIRDAQAHRSRDVLDLASVVECVVDDAQLVQGAVSLGRVDRPSVSGDPVALQRLFSNLLDNALKYGLSAEVSVVTQDADAVVRIRDQGPGLPEAELERVFEPFYRADASRNLDVGGIGLGLAVARSLAREHGGDVVLTSTATGLTATVWLPLA